MKDYFVVNKYTGHLLGSVRAATLRLAKEMAQAMFGCYASAEKY